MALPLLAPRRLVCPNSCGAHALERPSSAGLGGGAATLHDCPALSGLSVPMVLEGTRAEARIVEREDYVGAEQVTYADGRPVMAVEVMREDGNDVAAYAPLATPRAAA